MRAAVAPSLHGRWELRDIPAPTPGPTQVLIKIRASGLCYTDVHLTEGALPGVQFPCTFGHEPVGEIVALGPGVHGRAVGDRVGVPWVQRGCGRCEACSRGRVMFCQNSIGTGVGIAGGHAELMVAYADATQLIPEGLSYEQAAPIFCAGYTVWGGLRLADPKPLERIAVVGIGGLGHLAIQYAKAAGFETIAITQTKDKIDLVRRLGADYVVADGAALEKAGGADVILGTSNSFRSMTEALQGLRADGRLVIMGFSAEKIEIDPATIFMKRGRIICSLQNGREYLHEALDLAARGKVKVAVETYPLAEVGKAYERVAEGKVRFRAVITT